MILTNMFFIDITDIENSHSTNTFDGTALFLCSSAQEIVFDFMLIYVLGQSCRGTRTETSVSSSLSAFPTHVRPARPSTTKDSSIRARFGGKKTNLFLMLI